MRAWVIGGDSGIGKACVDRLDALGHAVEATGIEVDVRFKRQMVNYMQSSRPFDWIVYSAGINILSWDRDLQIDDASNLFDVNVFGFMRLIQIVAESQYRNKVGPGVSIVAISSDAATRPMRTSMAYCASKAALNACVKQAARELAPHVRVNAIAPGIVAPTGMSHYIDAMVPVIRDWTPERASSYETSQIPFGRRGWPSEVAEAVCNTLAGPSYMSGAIVEVNGGR